MKVMASGTEHFVNAFESSGINAMNTRPRWLNTLRKQAFERFESTGFPHRKHEEWKYTDISALQKTAFEPGRPPRDVQEVRDRFPTLDTEQFPSPRIVLVNGHYAPELSDLSDLGFDDTIRFFQTLSSHEQDDLMDLLTAAEEMESHLLTDLNTALQEDGVLINIPENRELEKPIHILHLNGDTRRAAMAHSHVVIQAGARSDATIVEEFFSAGDKPTFINHVTEVTLHRESRLTHIKINNENPSALHINNTRTRQFGNSEFNSFSFGLNGGMIRNDLNCRSLEPHTHTRLTGLYLPEGGQHIDNHTSIDHTVPDCTSHQLYKGILGDSGKAVFNGKIFVRKDAQHTDAFQSNRNILLSDNAHIDTKPQLEIFADDVKCAHGTTVGYLDTDALYYLQTRGITSKNARRLIVKGFANEIIRQIPSIRLREQIVTITTDKLDRLI